VTSPRLYPWTIAAASWLGGGRVTEGTAQAPVAVAAIATVLFTVLLADRLFGRRAGVWAALVLATTTGFLDLSQLLLPDMLVARFATLAGWAGWRMVSEPSNRLTPPLFYGASALAVFAKGPLGALPILAVASLADLRARAPRSPPPGRPARPPPLCRGDGRLGRSLPCPRREELAQETRCTRTYLGRTPRPIFAVEQVNELIGRDRRSVVVMDDPTWARISPSLAPGVGTLAEMIIGGERLRTVGAASP
jgi:Dolichyl-phosphate-mannose-protein mannosyltransferase